MISYYTLVVLFGLYFVLAQSLTLDTSTLRQANIIVRHGARSPTNPFPNDKYKDYWPQGFGQLTKVGIHQMAQMGSYLKTQYAGFLNDTYINDEFYVRSSNWDRTLMSAESLLAGLYPPNSVQEQFDPNIGWQPIPVHTVGQTEDILLDVDNPVCLPYDQLKQDVYDIEEFQKKNASSEAYYQRLKNYTGKTGDMNPYGVWDVYDTIYAEETENLTIPSWYTPKDEELMAGFYVPWQFDVHFGGLAKGRLKGGPLITEIVENMHLKVNNTISPARRKAFFYVGHDNNLVTTMMITQTYNWRYVPVASYLVVELHRVDDQDLVQMVFQNSTTKQEPPIVLNITVCEGKSACPLEEFIQAVSPYFITREEWNQLCNPRHLSTLTLTGIICVSVGVAAIFILIIGAILYVAKVGVRTRHPSKEQKDENTPLFL